MESLSSQTDSPLPSGEVDRAKRGRVRGYGLTWS
jgi:hypothetical protein